MRFKILVVIMSISLLLSLCVIGCETAAPDEIVEQPETTEEVKEMVIGTLELGTAGYKYMATLIDAMYVDYPDVRFRSIPVGTDVGRASLGRTGEVDVLNFIGLTVESLHEGIDEFNAVEWGPQEVFILFLPRHPGLFFATRGDSGYENISDLRGAKVAWIIGSTGTNYNVQALLALGGLTWDDVEIVELGGVAAGYSAVVEGRVDAYMMNPVVPAAYEGVESPAGLLYMPIPDDDKSWERVREWVSPLYSLSKTKHGAGVDPDNPLNSLTLPFPSLVGWKHLSEEKAYVFMKALFLSQETWRRTDPAMDENWDLEAHWKFWDNANIPMHPGAVKYYKEIGEWSEERETRNQELIERQKKLGDLWQETKDLAIEKQLASGDVPQLWLEQRKKAGF